MKAKVKIKGMVRDMCGSGVQKSAARRVWKAEKACKPVWRSEIHSCAMKAALGFAR